MSCKITYKNYKGEVRDYVIEPRFSYTGSTEYHPEIQHLLRADKRPDEGGPLQTRDFAIKDIIAIDGAEIHPVLHGEKEVVRLLWEASREKKKEEICTVPSEAKEPEGLASEESNEPKTTNEPEDFWAPPNEAVTVTSIEEALADPKVVTYAMVPMGILEEVVGDLEDLATYQENELKGKEDYPRFDCDRRLLKELKERASFLSKMLPGKEG